MKKFIVLTVFAFLTLITKAQKNYFIYLQTDNKQAFSIKMNGKDLSSSVSGYIVIPKLLSGEHSFVVSFPKSEWPKQSFNVLLSGNDEGYVLKNFNDKGWGLYNLQSMDIVMNGDPFRKRKIADENEEVIAKVTPKIEEEKPVEKIVEPVVEKTVEKAIEKVEEPATAKVATNNANRVPVENPVEKVVEKVVEKPVVVKPVEKIIEKVEEKPVVEKPIVEKQIEKVEPIIEEKPVVIVAEKMPEQTEEKLLKKGKEKITKVTSFDDVDGVTMSYRIKSESGTEIVPVFIEKGIAIDNVESTPRRQEKFINMDLPNPNEKKVEAIVEKAIEKVEEKPVAEKQVDKEIEKVEEPATAKVATNKADRVPVQQNVEKPIDKIIEKVEEKPVVKVIEKVEEKPIEKVVEKPVVILEKPTEKKIENVVESTNQKNPLNITVAEKSSKDSKGLASYNSDCKEQATEEDFFKTRKKMVAEDGDDAMVDVALKQFKIKCYTVEQIKNLALVFLTDIGRYKLLDAAYPFTSNANRYSELEPLFKEAYYIKRFKAMLDR